MRRPRGGTGCNVTQLWYTPHARVAHEATAGRHGRQRGTFSAYPRSSWRPRGEHEAARAGTCRL
eukprot:5478277-Pyramimonas_sp.AAC.1